MMKYWNIAAPIAALALCVGLAVDSARATDYFVDSYEGNDVNDGTAPDRAWRSLERVNAAEIAPGDVVRFRRGRVWRGTLRPRAGAEGSPTVYSAYGEGEKPRILSSVDLSDPSVWTPAGDGLWKTGKADWKTLGTPAPFNDKLVDGKWCVYTEEPAKARVEETKFDDLDGAKGYSLFCENNGANGANLQFTNAGFSTVENQFVRFRFKARSSAPFKLGFAARIFQCGRPWTPYSDAIESPSGEIGTNWAEYELIFKINTSADDARITFFIGARIPNGARFDFVPIGTEVVESNGVRFTSDVGNVVLTEKDSQYQPASDPALKTFVPTWDKKEYCGYKRWTLEDVKEENDFWFDMSAHELYFRSKTNPGERFASVEAPLRVHACAFNASDVVVENIAFTHTAAHGIASGRNERVVVRDCDFDWIGGGDIYSEGGDGRRVRFGNGVEFWNGSVDCLVERCKFSRVYDVAITTQGSDLCVSRNLTLRDNVMYRCEQAFEIWFSNKETVLENCVFERNLCVDCGRDWSHIQRPDKRGTAILGYGLVAKTVDVAIRDNVFCDTSQTFVWCHHDRVDGYKFSNNVYSIRADRPHENGDKYFVFNAGRDNCAWTFEEFQARGKDVDSRWIEPKFRDYEKDDLTLLNRDELGAGPLDR